jgi:DNA invertase Pin-like site-specific DNA recombinase
MVTQKRALLWIAVSSEAQAEEDKVSLSHQESLARAACERYGWRIVDVLIVPGFSRRYYTWHEFAADAAKKRITAGHEMERHWDNADFDVVVLYDGSRFGRSQSLFSYFVERTIDCGAMIYAVRGGGTYDKINYREWIAIGGYAAAKEIDRLVEKRSDTMDTYVEKGLPTSSGVLWTHRRIRHPETGKTTGLAPKEEYRQLFIDAANLLIGGLGWVEIGVELYRRYGYVDAVTQKPYLYTKIYRTMTHPTFWGHSARHYKNRDGQGWDMWHIEPDSGIAPPDTTIITYNTHEPMVIGELSEQLRAEIRRRRTAIRGTAKPHRTTPFTGLLVCGSCGMLLVYGKTQRRETHTPYRYYRCMTRHRNFVNYACDNRGVISVPVVQAYVDGLLRRLAAGMDFESMMAAVVLDDTSTLENEVEQLRQQINRLIEKQATADDSISQLYDNQIQSLSERYKAARRRVEDINHQKRLSNAEKEERNAALAAIDIDTFWQLEDTKINQHLHRIFGNWRMVSASGEITGVIRRLLV